MPARAAYWVARHQDLTPHIEHELTQLQAARDTLSDVRNAAMGGILGLAAGHHLAPAAQSPLVRAGIGALVGAIGGKLLGRAVRKPPLNLNTGMEGVHGILDYYKDYRQGEDAVVPLEEHFNARLEYLNQLRRARQGMGRLTGR